MFSLVCNGLLRAFIDTHTQAHTSTHTHTRIHTHTHQRTREVNLIGFYLQNTPKITFTMDRKLFSVPNNYRHSGGQQRLAQQLRGGDPLNSYCYSCSSLVA